MTQVSRRSVLLSLLALPACAGVPVGSTPSDEMLKGIPPMGDEADIIALARAIRALGPEVDPEEAANFARISYVHTRQLAVAYQITDPALIHNIKVNKGIKPRGLCREWAEDMEIRLVAEDFQSLTIHRAIGALIGVDHSTVIVSRKGDDMYSGIVVDPWRKGGRLTWIHTVEDTAWGWEPQLVVLDRQARLLAQEANKKVIVYEAIGVEPRCLDVTNPNAASVALNSAEGAALCTGYLPHVPETVTLTDAGPVSAL